MVVLTIALALLFVILTVLFRRAGLVRLAMLPLQGGAALCIAGSAQLASMMFQQQRLMLLVITALCLFWFCWLNRHQIGMVCITLGIALNMAVMAANGGVMPVSPTAALQVSGQQIPSGTMVHFSKTAVLDDERTALVWLSDRMMLPGLFNVAAWSIGDMFLLVGVSRLLWYTMKGDRPHDAWNVR
jgi:hypothetical protein